MDKDILSTKTAPLLLLVSAPSGAGKTTLCKRVIDRNPGFVRAVTCTTRAPRGSERHGVDYYFMDRSEFLSQVESGGFIEYAEVFGNLYGTLKSTVLENLQSGRDMVLNIDVQGAASVRKLARSDSSLARSLVTVFVTPPTRTELRSRLIGRGSEGLEVIDSRLSRAKEEVRHWAEFDYIIISGSKQEDAERLQSIVTAEKSRTARVHFRFDEKIYT